MNYKTLKEHLDKANGELAALKAERSDLIRLVKSSQRASRDDARKRGLAEGRLAQLSRSLR